MSQWKTEQFQEAGQFQEAEQFHRPYNHMPSSLVYQS